MLQANDDDGLCETQDQNLFVCSSKYYQESKSDSQCFDCNHSSQYQCVGRSFIQSRNVIIGFPLEGRSSTKSYAKVHFELWGTECHPLEPVLWGIVMGNI